MIERNIHANGTVSRNTEAELNTMTEAGRWWLAWQLSGTADAVYRAMLDDTHAVAQNARHSACSVMLFDDCSCIHWTAGEDDVFETLDDLAETCEFAGNNPDAPEDLQGWDALLIDYPDLADYRPAALDAAAEPPAAEPDAAEQDPLREFHANRAELERKCGGPLRIKLITPTNCGTPPKWEASIPTAPDLEPVQFHSDDDGGALLPIAAAKAWLIRHPAPAAAAETAAAEPEGPPPVALETPLILAHIPSWTADGCYIGQYRSLADAFNHGARFALENIGTLLDLEKPIHDMPFYQTVPAIWPATWPHPSDTADAAAALDTAAETAAAEPPAEAAEPPVTRETAIGNWDAVAATWPARPDGSNPVAHVARATAAKLRADAAAETAAAEPLKLDSLGIEGAE